MKNLTFDIFFPKSITILLFSIVTLFASYDSYGQYRPMLKQGNEWYHYVWHEGSCTMRIEVSKDTTINGLDYAKINSFGLSTCDFESFTLLREDTTSKKVYLFYNDTLDILLYDFSLKVGDSIKSDFMYFPYNLRLDSIKSVLPTYSPCFVDPPSLSITNPKIFYLSTLGCNFCRPIIWVEGIGNISSPFYSNTEWSAGNLGQIVLCHYTEGQRDYHYVYCYEPEPCNGPIVSTKDERRVQIKIHPNPFEDEINIESDFIPMQVEIYNFSGVLVKREINSTKINTRDLSSGLFYVLVCNKNGDFSSSIIFKN